MCGADSTSLARVDVLSDRPGLEGEQAEEEAELGQQRAGEGRTHAQLAADHGVDAARTGAEDVAEPELAVEADRRGAAEHLSLIHISEPTRPY